ncbi:MAG: hypothetical protein V1720_03315 [bacterium]
MAKSPKKNYTEKKSEESKIGEPMIEGLEVSETVVGLSSKEELLLTHNEIGIESKLTNLNYLKTKFISNSIGFFYYLNKSLGESNFIILPSLICALAIASKIKILKGNLEELKQTYWESMNVILSGEFLRAKHWGLTFFLLLYGKITVSQSEKKDLPFFNLLEGMNYHITKLKDGEKSIRIVIDVISQSDELQFFPELKNFLESITIDPFLSLGKVYEKIISLLDNSVIKDDRLNYWRQIIKAFCFVLVNSTKTPESFISELNEDNLFIKNELRGVLIAYFICKLYYDKPFEKTIPIVFLDTEKMKSIYPLTECLVSSDSIIESAKNAKTKLEEYFWTYVWGKPYPVFEKPEIKIVRQFQKKQIWIEEEMEVEERNFGDFIKVYGEGKSTGFIRLKHDI